MGGRDDITVSHCCQIANFLLVCYPAMSCAADAAVGFKCPRASMRFPTVSPVSNSVLISEMWLVGENCWYHIGVKMRCVWGRAIINRSILSICKDWKVYKTEDLFCLKKNCLSFGHFKRERERERDTSKEMKNITCYNKWH